MRFNSARHLPAMVAVSATAGLALVCGGYATAVLVTSIKPYAVSLDADFEAVPLLSAGDTVPVTGDLSRQYMMVGIPDGLGAQKNADGTISVFLNHELTNTTLSEPILGEPLNRGAFVSKLILNRKGDVISGDRAYDTVYIDDTFIGPAADDSNSTPGFGRFCSGFLAGSAQGFDHSIYFANEESTSPATFDGLGGLSVAIFDNEAHGLPSLGRFSWENTLVQPGSGRRTAIMGMEDGPASLDPAQSNSQLYLYVGTKDYRAGASVLQRNGLVNGTLYVFRSLNPTLNSEQSFQNGTIIGEWVEIPGAAGMSDVELEAASDAAGAMVFARPEDGAFNPRNKNNYFFVTTGGTIGANELGRLYSMVLNPLDPTKKAQLTIVYNADHVIAAGGDIAISPDNIDASLDYLTICEDGTSNSRPIMAAKGRDGSIWRFELSGFVGVRASSVERIVELDPPGRDGVAVDPGIWETSGIIDTTEIFGRGTWLFDVQAHSPTAPPAPNSVEDGQLLLLKKAPKT